jgi:hypothetical protein
MIFFFQISEEKTKALVILLLTRKGNGYLRWDHMFLLLDLVGYNHVTVLAATLENYEYTHVVLPPYHLYLYLCETLKRLLLTSAFL